MRTIARRSRNGADRHVASSGSDAQVRSADLVDGLLGAVAHHDRRAFDRLYEASAPRLYAVALRVLGPSQDADEAMQDAFANVWMYADQWPGAPGTGMPWLLTIVRNASIDRRRSADRHAKGLASIVRRPAVPSPVLTPEDAAMCVFDAEHLETCLEALPEDRAMAVRKAYFCGDSYAEIAEETGHPEGTLESWVHRSLTFLRSCLQSHGVESAQ